MRTWLMALAIILLPTAAQAGPSVYTRTPDDPAANIVTGAGSSGVRV